MKMHPKTEVTLEGLENSINRGIDYLHDHQLPNGEFIVYLSGDDAMQSWTLPESCIFPASLIGHSLLTLKEDKRVKEILDKTAAFLIYQMDIGATWNHYTILHRYRKVCPQDLDDTACVSHFLRAMNADFSSEINKKLILDNKRKDGLFYTWITFRLKLNFNKLYWKLSFRELKVPVKSLLFWRSADCKRNDVDAVVNANILYYLGNSNETKPIVNYLIKIIKENKENDCDAWYRNPITVYYFISRNFTHCNNLNTIKKDLISKVLKHQNKDGSFSKSSLETALAISTLLNLNYMESEVFLAAKHLISNQKQRGNWNRWTLYYSGRRKRGTFGSEEITTGYCLEALAKLKPLLLPT
ncbi:hypothetical protein PW52_15930 [Tamlana sedimentorum]|uniref:Prenyltransferase n=2 Tax=Neotamlana sedimentorum TaxID=1435349 RepID=A0A0D7W004_9FLAO|nr:hypothetical protein PW52_15930 [Tamlana sedimentorum]